MKAHDLWWALDYEWRRLAMYASKGRGPHSARVLIELACVPS